MPPHALHPGPRLSTACIRALLLVLLALVPAACQQGGEERRSSAPQSPPAAQQTAPDPAAAEPVILVLGDSLAAGLGLPPEQSFPAVLQALIRDAGHGFRVVNAGVSGDTTAGGLARMDWLLRQRVDLMILELGANDGLRGQSIQAMEENLSAIIEKARARGITVVLAEMELPFNYGAAYRRKFKAVYPALARKYKLALIPFPEDLTISRDTVQPDGLHPNAKGARIIARHIWRTLEPVLKDWQARRG